MASFTPFSVQISTHDKTSHKLGTWTPRHWWIWSDKPVLCEFRTGHKLHRNSLVFAEIRVDPRPKKLQNWSSPVIISDHGWDFMQQDLWSCTSLECRMLIVLKGWRIRCLSRLWFLCGFLHVKFVEHFRPECLGMAHLSKPSLIQLIVRVEKQCCRNHVKV